MALDDVIREDGIPTGGKSFNTRAQWIIENILKHNQSCTSQYPFRFAPTLLINPLALRSAIIRSICRALISRPSAILVFRHLFRYKDSGYSDIIKTVSVLPPYISSYVSLPDEVLRVNCIFYKNCCAQTTLLLSVNLPSITP